MLSQVVCTPRIISYNQRQTSRRHWPFCSIIRILGWHRYPSFSLTFERILYPLSSTVYDFRGHRGAVYLRGYIWWCWVKFWGGRLVLRLHDLRSSVHLMHRLGSMCWSASFPSLFAREEDNGADDQYQTGECANGNPNHGTGTYAPAPMGIVATGDIRWRWRWRWRWAYLRGSSPLRPILVSRVI